MRRFKKPKLVTQYLEDISSEGFEKHADIIAAEILEDLQAAPAQFAEICE